MNWRSNVRIQRRIVHWRTIASMLILLAGIASFHPASVHAAGLPSSAKLQSGAPKGTWKFFALPSGRSTVTPASVVGGGGGGSSCPYNATLYTGSLAPYNCYAVAYDGDGHGVWLRDGGVNTFGVAHFQTHNLEPWAVEAVVSMEQYGLRQSNGRYLYGAYFQDPDGFVDQQVLVFEERGKPSVSGVTDGNELGVVTAYCEDEFGNEEQLCPDWVNATL